ncbi:MAG: NrpR regulatory domain-containing protein [Candidatus Jordarchaeales archaeon]
MFKPGESFRKEVEILRILSQYRKPVGSTVIREELKKKGFLLSERAVRYHLQLLEEKGFVEGHERSGRTITTKGLEELSRALAAQRLDFVVTHFLSLAYSVTYRPESRSGVVVTNVFLMDKNAHDRMLETVEALWERRLLPAPYIKVLDEGEEYNEVSVPEGEIAFFTVCDLTIDGVLIRLGIPVMFKYGGLVQTVNYKPIRFVELISYEGTTIPPLEVFVRSNQTSITSFLETGSGMLPVVLREIPAIARKDVVETLEKLESKGWGGILVVGEPNEPVLGVPVPMDRFGLSMVGGITPGAALKEMGIKIETFAPHCLLEIKEMKMI